MVFTSIVISGLPGSGKSTLARRLSEIYGWPIHSMGELFREKWKTLHPDGKVPFETYWRRTGLEENRSVNEEFRRLVSQGSIIGEGRYFIDCQGTPTLFLFVTAPVEIRAARADRKKYSGNPPQVIDLLRSKEQDEVRMGQTLFGYDYRDPIQYHLVLNSGMLSVDQEVGLVKKLMQNI